MAKLLGYGLAVMMASALLVGCGGGGGVSQSTHDQLQTDLEDAQAELEDLETQLEEEDTETAALNDRITALTQLVADLTAEEEPEEGPAAEEDEEAEEEEEVVVAPPSTPDPTPTELTEAEKAVAAARAVALVPVLNLSGEAADTAEATVEWMRGDSLTFEPANISTPSGTAPSVPGGWRSGSFSRTRGADGTETAYLYTNIQSAGSKAFWKVYGDDVVSSDSDWDATLARRSGTIQFVDTDGDVDNLPDVGRFSGTYHGVGGTFTCPGSDTGACNAENATSPNTGLTMIVGTWTFAPTRSGLTSGVQQEQDTEYLYFGVWAYQPNDITAVPDFRWIGGGEQMLDANHFGALEGTAKFTGGALGQYALRSQAGQENDRIGTFTATAEFTANFDTNTIYGDITDFMEDGTSLGSNWSVYLGKDSSMAADLAATGATGVSTASIGGVSATGMWGATLHGSNNLGYTDFDDPGAGTTDCPLAGGCLAADLAGVTGWFDAISASTSPDADGMAVANAAIAGAFGAACSTGPCGR